MSETLREIPEGIYVLELCEQKIKPTLHEEARHREYLQLTWQIVDGPYAAFRVFDNLVMNVAAAARIAQYADAFEIGKDWDAVQEFLRTIHQYVGTRIRAHLRAYDYQGQQFMMVRQVFPFDSAEY